MGGTDLGCVLRHLRRLAGAGAEGDLSDGELLERFRSQHEEAAFTLLVQRHGPMVLAVCRRLLGSTQDAEDAFQATFLVLARRSGSIHKGQSVGSWLYGVATRLALRARAQDMSRRIRERQAPRPQLESTDEVSWQELRAGLDEELAQLPETYRAPLVLCYFEGKTHDQAAQELGCPRRSLSSRLARARELLRVRLTRRGLTLSSALLATALAREAAAGGVPALLTISTVWAARAALAGKTIAAVSERALALAEEVLKAMSATQLKIGMALLLAVGVAIAGAGVLAQQLLTAKPPQARQVALPGPAAKKIEPQPRGDKQARTDHYGDPLPPRALARMGTVRLRHESHSSLGAAFSPDGQVIATSGWFSVRLWEARTGKLIRQVGGDYRSGRLLFSPNGKWLAMEGSGFVCLLDVAVGRPHLQLLNPGSLLAFSPDSRFLATATEKQSVTLWDTATGKPGLKLEGGHKEGIISAAFACGGRTLVTLCAGKKLCRWEMATGKLQSGVALPLPQWRTLHLSADGRTLAVVPSSREAVQLWDTERGQKRCELQGHPACARYGLAFTPDGCRLATAWAEDWASEATLSLWHAATGRPLSRFPLPARAVSDLQFAPDGRTLLSTGDGPLVRLWDTTTGRRLLEQPAHEDSISSLSFRPDGRTLVSASVDGTVRVWDARTGRPLHLLAGHRGAVTALALLPDGRSALSSGLDGTLRFWDLGAGREIRRLAVEDRPASPRERGYGVLCMGLTADGRTAASFSSRWQPAATPGPQLLVQVWDLAGGKALTRRAFDTPNQNLEVRRFAPDLRIYVTYLDPFAVPPGKAVTDRPLIPPAGSIQAVLKEVGTGREVLALPQPDWCARREAFSPDGRMLVTATYRLSAEGGLERQDHHTLHFWELATGKERLAITGRAVGNRQRFEQLAFSRDGRTLALSRSDGVIQVWDVATGRELLRRTGCEAATSRLAFAPDGKSLATGHVDSTILLWDLTPEVTPGDRPAQAGGKDLEAWWADLAGPDAHQAHAAVWQLIAVPGQAVPLLRERLHRAMPLPAGRLGRLLADLSSEEFRHRQQATEQLAQLEELAEPALRAALAASPGPEQRRRMEDLLAGLGVVRSGERLRALRAVEVLEHIGTPEARGVLESLAQGAPEARLTRGAKASLERLTRRAVRAP